MAVMNRFESILHAPGKPFQRLLIVFVVTLLVRIVLEIVLSEVIPEWTSGSSKRYRLGLAESILGGEGFSMNGVPSLYQTPAYPFFLASVFFLFGTHWWTVVISQGLLEALSSVGIALIGERFSAKGWTAGLVYALYPYTAMQSRSIIDTSLFIFLFIWSIVCLIRFIDRRRLKDLVFGGIFLGAGFLARPVILPVAFGLVIGLCFTKMKMRQIILYTTLAGLISVSFPLSWTARNFLLTEQFPVFSVAGAHSMWYGHNRHVLVVYQRGDSLDAIGRDPRYPMTPNVKVAEFFELEPRDQVKLAEVCKAEVSAWIRENPAEVLHYSLLKLRTIFSWEYFPRSIDAPYQNLRKWLYRITNGPIIVLGWLGLVLLIVRKNPFAAFMWCVALGFVLLHVAVMVFSRHMLPLDALLMTTVPLSYEFLKASISRIRKRETG